MSIEDRMVKVIFNWYNINKFSCFSCTVTICTLIVIFITESKFYKIKRWLEYRRIKNNVSREDSGVLIVSICKDDIENRMKLCLKETKDYKNIPNERILKVEK
ncbi:hypothetical protein [Clostridium senegalense]|uniref:hypothetical protein n=1 Tax=Clostridium senegalense TaxID=1465809 RepID=UPI001FAD4163|nr:hypothetical protein [Clostridium senegalense]